MTMGNLCRFVAAFALAMAISLVKADKCPCIFGKLIKWPDGGVYTDCAQRNLTEIPQCVTNPKLQIDELYVFVSLEVLCSNMVQD